MALLTKLKQSLAKTRESFSKKIDDIFVGNLVLDDESQEQLFDILIQSDFGPAAAQRILDALKEHSEKGTFKATLSWQYIMKKEILSILKDSVAPLTVSQKGLCVYLFLGVNGAGKTTSIAKLGYYLAKEHHKNVLLCAADTFRAAAIDQLLIWGERINVPVITQREGADPGAVVFDALASAKARQSNILLVDTAGRFHTKVSLMEELKKIKRIIQRENSSHPQESFLVLDANFGQNALSQAKLFKDAVDITGLILTKLDGTARGGSVVQIFQELCVPVKFIGTGEGLEDFQIFNPGEFVDALFIGAEASSKPATNM